MEGAAFHRKLPGSGNDPECCGKAVYPMVINKLRNFKKFKKAIDK